MRTAMIRMSRAAAPSRRCSVSQTSSTNWRMWPRLGDGLAGHHCREEGFLRVEAVLGLVEDHGLCAFDDVFRDFLTPVGGQVVHEDSVRLREGHEVGTHLVGLEGLDTGAVAGFLTHRGPDVGVNDVGVAN